MNRVDFHSFGNFFSQQRETLIGIFGSASSYDFSAHHIQWNQCFQNNKANELMLWKWAESGCRYCCHNQKFSVIRARERFELRCPPVSARSSQIFSSLRAASAWVYNIKAEFKSRAARKLLRPKKCGLQEVFLPLFGSSWLAGSLLCFTSIKTSRATNEFVVSVFTTQSCFISFLKNGCNNYSKSWSYQIKK